MLSVSLTRLTKTSPLHRKSYSDGTLDLGILGSNMSNVQSLQVVLSCKEIPRQWKTVKGPNVIPVSLERVIVEQIKINKIKKNPMKEQELKKDNLLPGKMVSADHYISRAPGRLYHTKGKSDKSDMFSGGLI